MPSEHQKMMDKVHKKLKPPSHSGYKMSPSDKTYKLIFAEEEIPLNRFLKSERGN